VALLANNFAYKVFRVYIFTHKLMLSLRHNDDHKLTVNNVLLLTMMWWHSIQNIFSRKVKGFIL